VYAVVMGRIDLQHELPRREERGKGKRGGGGRADVDQELGPVFPRPDNRLHGGRGGENIPAAWNLTGEREAPRTTTMPRPTRTFRGKKREKRKGRGKKRKRVRSAACEYSTLPMPYDDLPYQKKEQRKKEREEREGGRKERDPRINFLGNTSDIDEINQGVKKKRGREKGGEKREEKEGDPLYDHKIFFITITLIQVGKGRGGEGRKKGICCYLLIYFFRRTRLLRYLQLFEDGDDCSREKKKKRGRKKGRRESRFLLILLLSFEFCLLILCLETEIEKGRGEKGGGKKKKGGGPCRRNSPYLLISYNFI